MTNVITLSDRRLMKRADDLKKQRIQLLKKEYEFFCLRDGRRTYVIPKSLGPCGGVYYHGSNQLLDKLVKICDENAMKESCGFELWFVIDSIQECLARFFPKVKRYEDLLDPSGEFNQDKLDVISAFVTERCIGHAAYWKPIGQDIDVVEIIAQEYLRGKKL